MRKLEEHAASGGSGQEKIATYFGTGTQRLTFAVGNPGDAPVLEVTAHPLRWAFGPPVEGTGILIQIYSVTASLTEL